MLITKTSMEIEIPKRQQILIEGILNKKIGVITKAYLLKTDPNLDKDAVLDYLISKDMNVIRDYLKHPEQLIPPPRSAYEWSNSELEYYLVGGKDFTIPVSYEVFFGSKKEAILPEKIQKFLKFHDNKLLQSYRKCKPPEKLPNSEFFTLFSSYYGRPAYEARVDNLMRYFFHKICGKDFLAEMQVPLELYVNKTQKEATPDVAITDMPLRRCQELIIVEDKTTKNVTCNHEAQIIAEGIAVAQQKQWKEEWTVYMVGIVGLIVTIYKANFSQELLKNVANGINCCEGTKIFKLEDSFDFEDENERELLAKVLIRITEELKKRLI